MAFYALLALSRYLASNLICSIAVLILEGKNWHEGIIGIVASSRNGNVAASFPVNQGDEIILSTDKGSIMRCAVKEIRIAGRNTQGVRIKKLSGNEKVVSVIKIEDNIQ